METALFVFIGLIVTTITAISFFPFYYMLDASDKNGEKAKILNTDSIKEIGIDEDSRLYVKPTECKLLHIYQAAMEIHWNEKRSYLYSPKPRDWSYLDWYKQIISAAKAQSTGLVVNEETVWVNVPDKLKQEILRSNNPKETV